METNSQQELDSEYETTLRNIWSRGGAKAEYSRIWGVVFAKMREVTFHSKEWQALDGVLRAIEEDRP